MNKIDVNKYVPFIFFVCNVAFLTAEIAAGIKQNQILQYITGFLFLGALVVELLIYRKLERTDKLSTSKAYFTLSVIGMIAFLVLGLICIRGLNITADEYEHLLFRLKTFPFVYFYPAFIVAPFICILKYSDKSKKAKAAVFFIWLTAFFLIPFSVEMIVHYTSSN